MIELDQTSEFYVTDFDHLKNPPTHADIVMVRYCIPPEGVNLRTFGMQAMCRPHIEAVYIYGRLNEEGQFMQSKDDVRVHPVHAGFDMTEYNVEEHPSDNEARKAWKEKNKKTLAIKENLLAEGQSPHPEDPTQTLEARGKRKNKFTEFDLDIIFAHTEYKLIGKAIPSV